MENKNINNKQSGQSCLNCLYEYTCNWENSSDRMLCSNWKSDRRDNPTEEL